MRNTVAAMIMVGACDRSPPPPVPTVFSPQEAGHICLTLETCFPIEFGKIWGGSLAACTTEHGYVPFPETLAVNPLVTTGFEPTFTRLYQCILSATDCTAAAACLAQTGSAGTCAPDALENGKCSGPILSGCTADGFVFATDCTVDGEVCGPAPAIFGSFNACVTPCPAEPQCDGTKAELCLNGALALEDCAPFGAQCVNAACSGPAAEACDPNTFHPECDGTVAVTCGRDGVTRQDCALWPTKRRCGYDDYGRPECVVTGTECADDAQRCDGNDVVYCRDGSRAKQSCVQLGFAGCDNGLCIR
jgi:hypothetical protein